MKRWFFEKGDPRTAAVLRIAYGLIYLFMLWDLYPYLSLLMGHAGLFGSLEKDYLDLSNPLASLYRFDQPWQLQVWFWASVAVTLGVILGLFTRFSSVLMFLSILLFQKRLPVAIYGADHVLILSFFWMLFVHSNHRWSLDNTLAKAPGKRTATVEAWPMKAIQLQIAFIYLYSGLHKLGTESWRDGSAVYYAVESCNLDWINSLNLLSYKPLLAAMTYFALFVELSFVFLVFQKSTKLFALSAALLMHMGIDLFMNIRFFSLTMYAGFLSYLTGPDWAWIAARSDAMIPERFRATRLKRMKRKAGERDAGIHPIAT